MTCKCAIVTNQKPDYGQFHIKFCPMHEAAPQLLEALQSIAEHSKEFGDIEDAETMLYRVEDKAKAAVLEVEKEMRKWGQR
jgi:hypothetical protein